MNPVVVVDIELMRGAFNALPVSQARTAYAAVEAYIALCSHMAGNPSLPAAVTVSGACPDWNTCGCIDACKRGFRPAAPTQEPQG